MCSLNKVQDYVPRSAYLISDKELPPLKHNAPYKPGIKGRVAVIPKDTLDAAYALEEARELLGSTDETMICIFNMINAATPDCGCLSGHSAQEEHLCCRSTLPQALPSRFHRMGELECVYSPSVIGLHENDKKGDFLIPSQESPHKILKYSVISMMAQHKRLNVQSENNWRSKDQNLMVQKMRLILRTAASNRHRRLILGPVGEEFLSDKEFEGWFEIVVFAISDRGNDSDYNTFRDALHGLPI
ncbi:hypothetical protein N7470_007152 [Penicillium chermesinum]|nr:hypothetical protein N7470_007152 [Penicillium chermesinum]